MTELHLNGTFEYLSISVFYLQQMSIKFSEN